MKQKIKLFCYAGVPKYLIKVAERLLTQLSEQTEFSRRVNVHIGPYPIVQLADGRKTFGVFNWCKKSKKVTPDIIMFGNLSWLRKHMTQEEAIDAWRFVLAHEIAHYEQWRDDKTIGERGVDVRAKHLLRKCGYEYEAINGRIKAKDYKGGV